MAVNGIEIEVGQDWKTGEGSTVTIVERVYNRDYHWKASSGGTFTDEGNYVAGETGSFDLVELLSPAPAKGEQPSQLTPALSGRDLRAEVWVAALAESQGSVTRKLSYADELLSEFDKRFAS